MRALALVLLLVASAYADDVVEPTATPTAIESPTVTPAVTSTPIVSFTPAPSATPLPCGPEGLPADPNESCSKVEIVNPVKAVQQQLNNLVASLNQLLSDNPKTGQLGLIHQVSDLKAAVAALATPAPAKKK